MYDACVADKQGKITDKRLSIEFSAFRQDLWRSPGSAKGDPHYDDEKPSTPTDEIRWIDTDVMPADCLTKAMDTEFLTKILHENKWDTSQPHASKLKKQAKSESRKACKERKLQESSTDVPSDDPLDESPESYSQTDFSQLD